MNVYDAVRTVLAVRRYRAEPVGADIVRRIIDAGRLTGSSMNQQPWHFIVVEDRAHLSAIGAAVRTGRYIAEAAFAIAVAIEKDGAFAVSDASRAFQSMILAAWSEGVGSNWVGFTRMTKVAELLGVPRHLDVLAVVPFGYPGRRLGRGRKTRKPLAEVAHRERFGEPFR